LKNNFFIQSHNILDQIKNKKFDGFKTSPNFMIVNEFDYQIFLIKLNEKNNLRCHEKKILNIPIHLFLIGGVGIGKIYTLKNKIKDFMII
jgi:hypothetical protein